VSEKVGARRRATERLPESTLCAKHLRRERRTLWYWHDGTEGSVDPNNKQFSIVNNSPDSILQVYSLKARKGLPLGFEIVGARHLSRGIPLTVRALS
jgi:hypothetical protein